MSGSFINCPEIVGKTIQSLKIYPESHEGCEVLLEFTDGTAFTWCVGHKPEVKAQLYRAGVGTLEVLCNYEA
jgi:hypothetical protein